MNNTDFDQNMSPTNVNNNQVSLPLVNTRPVEPQEVNKEARWGRLFLSAWIVYIVTTLIPWALIIIVTTFFNETLNEAGMAILPFALGLIACIGIGLISSIFVTCGAAIFLVRYKRSSQYSSSALILMVTGLVYWILLLISSW